MIKGTALKYPIVGQSKAMDALVKSVNALARGSEDVAIVGEPGTGKGAIAKNIHALETEGQQRGFLSVNLSVTDDKELDTVLQELERTDEGSTGTTVLIEEIDEASFRSQMKILGFIKSRAAGNRGRIRFLVTLKEHPRKLAEKRKLYEELSEALRSFEQVNIMPLRERPEDIPLLVKHFASELCKELGMADLAIDINAIDVLVRQPWRENIRELKAVVDKSVLFSSEGRFMLPPELVDEKTEVIKMLDNIESGHDFVLDQSLDIIEKGIIERALNKFGFNQSKAAIFLGMTEQTFRYKLKRLGIASARAR